MYQGVWKLTLYQDLAPLGKFLREVQAMTSNLRAEYQTKLQNRRVNHLAPYQKAATQMFFELSKTQLKLIRDFEQIPLITQNFTTRTRPRRSLLPIGGSLLKLVFGTVDEAEIRQIRDVISKLMINQKLMHHAIEQNLSVVNTTRSDVSANRDKLNELITEYDTINTFVTSVSHELNHALNMTGQILETETKLRAAVDQIMHLTMLAEYHLQEIYIRINMLVTQKLSPSLILPKKLASLVRKVADNLPANLKPLTDLENVWHSYTTLSCRTTFTRYEIYTIIDIPLYNPSEIYTMFSVTPLKVYHNVQNLSLSAYAAYEPDINYILLEAKGLEFYSFSENELVHCPLGLTPLCKLNRPKMYSDSVGSCVLDIYFKRSNKKECNTVVSFPVVWPVVTQ